MIDIDVALSLGNGILKQKFRYTCQIPVGKIVTVFGKSGVGKTTFLRVLAGLENPSSGTIHCNSNVWFDSQKNILLSPNERDIKMVFQQNTLFPNMTVLENLAFAKSKSSDLAFHTEIIEGLELTNLLNLYPYQISGGQAQRVAIGQMLIGKPTYIVLDEPLTSLDQSLRRTIQDFLKTIQRKYQMTMVVVSHDLEETIKLSDQVLILEDGVFIDHGSPLEVFDSLNRTQNSILGKVVQVKEIGNKQIKIYVLVADQIIEKVYPLSQTNAIEIGASIAIEFA